MANPRPARPTTPRAANKATRRPSTQGVTLTRTRVRTPTPDQPLTPDEALQRREELLEEERVAARAYPDPAFAHRGPFCECHRLTPEARARGSLCDACFMKLYTLQAEAEARGERRFGLDLDTLLFEDRGRHPNRVWLEDVVDYRYASQYHFPLQLACLRCHGIRGLALDRVIVVAGEATRELSIRTHPEIVMQVALMAHADITRRRAGSWGIDGNRYLLPRPCVCACHHDWREVEHPAMCSHVYQCRVCGVRQTVDSSD